MNDSLNIIEILKNIPNNFETAAAYLPTAFTGMAVVMAELALIAVAILAVSRIARLAERKTKKSPPSPVPSDSSSGKLELDGVDEASAAVIMAIVSFRSGIPLNRLNFKSIKRIEDKKA